MPALPDHIRPIVIASHPRSGTHITLDLLRKQFTPCRSWKWPGEKNNRLYLTLESLLREPSGRISEAHALRVLGRVERPLIKTHLTLSPDFYDWPEATRPVPDWLSPLLQRSAFCYVVRDGRDVMCSLHLYHKTFDRRAHCPLSEFIRQEVEGMTRVRAWAHHVEQGLAQSGSVLIRFEEMVKRPDYVLGRVGEKLEMTPLYRQPLLPRKLRGLWHSRLNRAVGTRPECTAILGRPHGDKLERWREAFTAEDRAFFHDQAGDVLIRLGYESCDGWIGRERGA